MTAHADSFGYGYFDDPDGLGYRGYDRELHSWPEAVDECLRRGVETALDIGCGKGFLVQRLLRAGVDAKGMDVSDYALSFARGLPCEKSDVRDGVVGQFDAVIALGVLIYVPEDEITGILENIRRSTKRIFLFDAHYAESTLRVPDPHRTITRPLAWWLETIEQAAFRISPTVAPFKCFEPST
ncbi:class I SAM-dependent methyltransferase [Sinorhizobium meliloti]|uniref:class I SAM-dependent methyltransferase n=1 Tax=Rhizobium meliloti TaxID=382 RepID=UPI0018E8B3DB|nr:class I SAM-dependent methyltransferase [Sinorhizobium meliloti]QQF02440.1 class I SAM-dependent methyltransferase [Sinorhizobium meliloti]